MLAGSLTESPDDVTIRHFTNIVDQRSILASDALGIRINESGRRVPVLKIGHH